MKKTMYMGEALVRPVDVLCKSELVAFCTVQSMDWAGNPWIILQNVDQCFMQRNPCFAHDKTQLYLWY